MNNNLYIDIHVLQTVPPSCVNRDDTGSPKTAVYGGVTRARVSSQAWKRAVRMAFYESLAEEQIGVRTKHYCEMINEELQALGINDNNKKRIENGMKLALSDKVSYEKGTDSLFFMSRPQAKALAQLIAEDCEDKDRYKQALRDKPGVDIAMFGRMVADDPSLNVDATVQVAHAISTHAVQNEFDYFTAVDDKSAEDNGGAGHLGTVEFNSSTLYRYATVNYAELKRLLGEESKEAAAAFIDAFVRSMPTGKVNTFANRTLPDGVYVVVRHDQPVSYAAAFEQPVKANDGFVNGSWKAMREYDVKVAEYVEDPEHRWVVGTDLIAGVEKVKLPQLLEAIKAIL